jgi:hypothetical protein
MRGIAPIEIRYADVHDHHIRRKGPHPVDRFPAVSGFSDDLKILLFFQQKANPLSKKRMVVD